MTDSPPLPLVSVARTLVEKATIAALSTDVLRPVGHPFGYLVEVACDGAGRPILLLSRLAEQIKNVEADPRASLLVTDSSSTNPLAGSRVTLLGNCRRVDPSDRDSIAEIYLGRHPDAST